MNRARRVRFSTGLVIVGLACVPASVASARVSAHCPAMPGEVVASSASVEVSREAVTVLDHLREVPGSVYRVCALREGAYAEQLLDNGNGWLGSPEVRLAGDHLAIHGRFRASGPEVLRLYALARADETVEVTPCPAAATCTGIRTGIRDFAFDQLGRLAWVESFGSGGVRWARLWTRTQAGKTHSVERHLGATSITGVRIVGDRVRWSADGRARKTTIARPRCQMDGDTDTPWRRHVWVANRDLLLASIDHGVMGCLRSDGRWRGLFALSPESSHGQVLTGILTAGTWISLSWNNSEVGGSFRIVDLRSGRSVEGPSFGYYWPVAVDALAPDGAYVFHTFQNAPDNPGVLTGVRLYAARPGQPAIQLDEGARVPSKPYLPDAVPVFTDVHIAGDHASWTNDGVAKTAQLP